MLAVADAVKNKLKSDICRKELTIYVGAVTCTNTDIYQDSFELTECIMDGKVEFVGCISSILKARISTSAIPKSNIQGQVVSAEVQVYFDDNTLSTAIPLFHGFVDTCETSADGHWQDIVCYDILGFLSDTPAYNIYKSAFGGSSVSLKNFRDSVFSDLGIAQDTQTLPNDDVMFKKRYRNKELTALCLLKNITQIQGSFGIIDRDGYFTERYIDGNATPESIPYYRKLEYSNTVIDPIHDGLIIRTNSQDAGNGATWVNYQTYVGTDPGWSDDTQDTYLVDENDDDVVNSVYVIEGNIVAFKLKPAKRNVLAANIMDAITQDAVFRKYEVTCNGLPYVECGDKVQFTKADGTQIAFVVTKRVLKGVQNMTDTYTCNPTQEVVGDGSGGTATVSGTDGTYVSNVNNTPTSSNLALTQLSVTQNGTYTAVGYGAEGFSEVEVNVSGGGGGGVVGNFLYYRSTVLYTAFADAGLDRQFSGFTYVVLPTTPRETVHLVGTTGSVLSHYTFDGSTFSPATALPTSFTLADETTITIKSVGMLIPVDANTFVAFCSWMSGTGGYLSYAVKCQNDNWTLITVNGSAEVFREPVTGYKQTESLTSNTAWVVDPLGRVNFFGSSNSAYFKKHVRLNDISSWTWEQVAPDADDPSVTELPFSASGSRAAYLTDTEGTDFWIHVVGGTDVNNANTYQHWMYDGRKWGQYADLPYAASSNTLLLRFHSVLHFFLNQHHLLWRYAADMDIWTEHEPVTFPSPNGAYTYYAAPSYTYNFILNGEIYVGSGNYFIKFTEYTHVA